MTSPESRDELSQDEINTILFEEIAQNLSAQGYSVHTNTPNANLLRALSDHLLKMPSSKFKQAGIGRDEDHIFKETVRGDGICWINKESKAETAWLSWTELLQQYLNRRLFLGLFSFESHFAHYAPGDFYKKHQDAFNGETNRVLSIVLYLNEQWNEKDGGELVLYSGDAENTLTKVIPGYGTLVIFLSEEFPHEVLPATRDRYSIAGWFRVNNPGASHIDPPK